jgi:hypothetical protein
MFNNALEFFGCKFISLIYWSLPSTELFSIVWSEFLQAMTGDLQQDSLAPAQPREVGGGPTRMDLLFKGNHFTLERTNLIV